jgi:hypothetical protein
MDDTKTMTAEEVERDVETVRDGLQPRPKVPARLDFREAALSRLAAQAARVPGLVADVQDVVGLLPEDRRKDWKEFIRSALAIEEGLMRGISNHLPDWSPTDCPSEAISHLASLLEDAESERDAARKEVERLGSYVEKLKIDVSGHVGTIHEQHDTISTLRERVATLETQRNRYMAEIARQGGVIAELNDLHNTAESRVRELVDDRAVILSVLADIGAPEHSGDDEVPPGVALPIAERVRRLASHPAPTTGAVSSPPGMTLLREALNRANDARLQLHDWDQQGPTEGGLQDAGAEAFAALGGALGEAFTALCALEATLPTPPPGLLDLLGDFLTTLASTPRNPYPDEDDPRAAGWADALDAMREGANALTGALNAARASRVPALPGLLEAVGPVLKGLEGYSIALSQDGDKGAIPVWLSRGEARAIRAAYDAAKGGRYAKTPEESSDAQGRAARDAAVSEDMEDAAKYRAAVERFKDVKATEHCTSSRSEEFRRGEVSGAAYVLGLTLATPPSGPGGGEGDECANVCEHGDHPAPEGRRFCSRACQECEGMDVVSDDCAGVCHATPSPTCATCGHPHKEHADGPCLHPVPVDDDTRRCGCGDFTTRARIAPTPTPEVPPLKAEPWPRDHAFVPGDSKYGWERQCAHVVEGMRHCGASPDHHAQPSAPEVVWEGDGVQVLADGNWGFRPGGTYHGGFNALARALAEAKREVEGMRGERDAERQIAQEWEAKAYKAAESMRERCVASLRSEIDHGEWSDTARDMLMNVADAIRAMPLEQP